MVQEPSFLTLALHEVRRLRSRSVAVSESWSLGGFEQIIGKDWNRGLALDHTLGGSQFLQKFELADCDFHRRSLRLRPAASTGIIRFSRTRLTCATSEYFPYIK